MFNTISKAGGADSFCSVVVPAIHQLMYKIEDQEITQEFAEMWAAAGDHLNKQVDGGIQTWLRCSLGSAMLEHLSFRLGNQLFFLHVVDVDGKVFGPGSYEGLKSISNGCNGHCCLLPMKKHMFQGWQPARPSWGLISPEDGSSINPIELVSDEDIVMTDWELHDFAVQVVRDDLTGKGFKITSVQGNPAVNPSLWFLGDSGQLEFVVVGHGKYPAKAADRPNNIDNIRDHFDKLGYKGNFASVVFSSEDEAFNPLDTQPMCQLYRGHGFYIKYEGIEALS